MRNRSAERKIIKEFEQTLQNSGVSFDSIASQVDFSKYEKKSTASYKRPWVYALASFAFVAVATGATIGIVLGTQTYYNACNQFREGVFHFSEITTEYNVEELPKPSAEDTIVIGNKPVGNSFFPLSQAENGYEGYLSVSGALAKYKLNITRSYWGGLDFSFEYSGANYTGGIYGTATGDDVFCSIEAPSRRLSFFFSK